MPTQYDPSFPFGQMDPLSSWRNEDLENQTFSDGAFDIVLAQDVFEHLFHPGAAAREIARTLKQGGLCLLSVPLIRQWEDTQRRAELAGENINHLLPEMYHGNPVGDGRSLVTVDWSIAIGPYLSTHSGIPFVSILIDDMSMAIRDPFNCVLVGLKDGLPDLAEPLLNRRRA